MTKPPGVVDGAQVLARLEAFLLARHPSFARDPVVIETARTLSVGYTEHRRIDEDAAGSLAYLAHFGPRAVVAVAHALRALPDAASGTLGGAHVVDFGCGSGASSLPWIAAGVRRLTLVDRSARALELAVALLRWLAPDAVVDVIRADVLAVGAPGVGPGARPPVVAAAPAVRHATHVGAAFVVGEWSAEDAAPAALTAWLERAAPQARSFVLVDAGDHPRARRLQQLRDDWVVRADRTVHGPCPHRDPCPALTRARDWCHDVVDKALPTHLAAFARAVGRDDRAMAASWLSVSRAAALAPTLDELVVIGEPQRDKGRVRLPVCGPRGLRFVQALKRHRGAFALVSELPRGMRLPVPPAEGDTAHVDDATVTMLGSPLAPPRSSP